MTHGPGRSDKMWIPTWPRLVMANLWMTGVKQHSTTRRGIDNLYSSVILRGVKSW